jgi:bifunctional N-acetylglucosamine-1-phosphate-uridyltransferase/glucosamine-1-phosphate-acetyltransferase GlmU-like protein
VENTWCDAYDILKGFKIDANCLSVHYDNFQTIVGAAWVVGVGCASDLVAPVLVDVEVAAG